MMGHALRKEVKVPAMAETLSNEELLRMRLSRRAMVAVCQRRKDTGPSLLKLLTGDWEDLRKEGKHWMAQERQDRSDSQLSYYLVCSIWDMRFGCPTHLPTFAFYFLLMLINHMFCFKREMWTLKGRLFHYCSVTSSSSHGRAWTS